jgi:hypothetical protein
MHRSEQTPDAAVRYDNGVTEKENKLAEKQRAFE